jgi:hypothetical protein
LIDLIPSLTVIVLALVPGAAYTLAYERVVGSYGGTARDRIVRLVTASAILQAIFSGLSYFIYRHLFVQESSQHAANAFLVELISIVYVGVPVVTGSLVGHGIKKGKKWAVAIGGNALEPRAWDYLWQQRPIGYVRLRMKSGVWVGGFYGPRSDGRLSWAAGYPEVCDLYVARMVSIDKGTGEFILSQDGRPISSDEALLVRWDEVEYLTISEVDDE